MRFGRYITRREALRTVDGLERELSQARWDNGRLRNAQRPLEQRIAALQDELDAASVEVGRASARAAEFSAALTLEREALASERLLHNELKDDHATVLGDVRGLRELLKDQWWVRAGGILDDLGLAEQAFRARLVATTTEGE